MTVQLIKWDSFSAEELSAAGNQWVKVFGRDGDVIVWEGFCAGWNETPNGGLTLSRQLALPGTDYGDGVTEKARVEVKLIANGGWTSVEADGCLYDPEAFIAIKEQRRQAEEQMRSQEAAERLGLAGPGRFGVPPGVIPVQPNRAGRRHPQG